MRKFGSFLFSIFYLVVTVIKLLVKPFYNFVKTGEHHVKSKDETTPCRASIVGASLT